MHDTQVRTRVRSSVLLAMTSVIGSGALAIALVIVHVAFRSQVALAHAADSVSDFLAGSILFWAMRTGANPPDVEHPYGHARAEPIAALVVAVLGGVLAVEVFRNAAFAVIEGASPELDWLVAGAFTLKIAFKAIVFATARRLDAHANPAVLALAMDARNDVLIGSVTLLGLAVSQFRLPSIDAWLAMAVSVWVGRSAWTLARENVRLLIGESASSERLAQLEAIVRAVDGVVGVDSVVATWAGPLLHVHIDIVVARQLSLEDAHRIGHAVESRVLEAEDVARVVVHVGPAEA